MSGKPPAQKAWTTGTNPITQKQGGSAMANGLANGHSQTSQEQGKIEGRGSQGVEKQAHDRLLFLLSSFVGLDATLTLKTGEQFQGVFSGASSQNGPPRYHMAMVRKLNTSAINGTAAAAHNTLVGDGEEHRMAFDVSETGDLSVNGVTLGALQSRIPNGSAFKTDTEISGNMNTKERTLQRWQPGPDEQTDMSLGHEASHGNGEWDQFAANEALYNVRSDYDEDLYTTSINRSNPRYKQIEARAERLAREIEGGSKRNDPALDSGLDEEDKYSGVRRDTPTLGRGGSNAYVPPSKRPITTNPTVSGAPFDPAIISSQLAKSDNAALQAQSATNTNSAEIQDKGKQPATESTDTTTKSSAASATSSTKAAIPSIPGGKTAAEHGTDIMRNVSDAFKLFSQSEKLKIQSEKLKIQQQQRQNQQQRTAHARQEKSVKINDLKKFSQNFKLNSLVPDDLVPILAKSKEKQEEIIQKAEQQVREREEQKTQPTVAQPTSSAVSAEKGQTSQPPAQNPNGATETKVQVDTRNQPPQIGRASGVAAASGPRPPVNQNQRTQATVRSAAAGAGTSPSLVPAPSQATAGGQSDTSRVLSPTSASAAARSFNVKALEFKPNPTASAFAPTGSGADASGSKRPSIASPTPASTTEPVQMPFFASPNKKSKFAGGDWASTTANAFNVPARLMKETQADESKKAQFANNGGIPQGYRTPPVWDVPEANAEKSYVEYFPKTVHPSGSTMHMAQSSLMPHQHQLPLHLQNGTPHSQQQQQQFYRAQHHPMTAQHSEDQRMHYSSSTSSVQPSPRMAQQAVAFNGQNHVPMAGYPYAMAPAGMAMRPVPGAGQYMTPQGAPIGGHMMVQQPSNGPFGHATPQQMQMYPSPVPNHVQPQFGGHPGQAGMPGGFAGSPRAHPMSHQGSQQGHAPQQMFIMPNQMMMMMPQHNGPPPMRGYQGQFQGQHPQNAYAMQHRAMSSSGYGQNMTPRQQHAMPHQGSMGTPMHPSASTNGEDGR